MTDVLTGLEKRLDTELAKRWRSADGQISKFLREVGLTGEEHNRALYILPKPTKDMERRIKNCAPLLRMTGYGAFCRQAWRYTYCVLTHGFQLVAPFPTHLPSSGQIHAETTIDAAVARSAALAVTVLVEALDVTLQIVDDVALTTGAPTMARFDYRRMVSQKSRSAPCPCRSGQKAKNCPHRWADEPPQVAERFRVGDAA
jgi:hypothetical protein